jgi:hypothetical protein
VKKDIYDVSDKSDIIVNITVIWHRIMIDIFVMFYSVFNL